MIKKRSESVIGLANMLSPVAAKSKFIVLVYKKKLRGLITKRKKVKLAP